MNFKSKLVVTFVAVLTAVLAVGIVAPLVGGDDTDAPPEVEVENPQYTADRIVLDDTPGQASVEMNSNVRNKTVLVNAGPSVRERQLRPLINALSAEGHDVRIHGGEKQRGRPAPPRARPRGAPAPPTRPPGSEEPIGPALEDAHALVSVGSTSYTREDVQAIGEFAEDGGRVLLLADPQQSFTTDLSGLAVQSELDVYTDPGYFYNLQENDLNHMRVFAEPDGPSTLTKGVDRLLFAGATPVGSEVTSDLATVIEGTNLSTTRAGTDAAVLTREDAVALVGDTEFTSPVNVQRADNDAFVGNLADFLVTGERKLESAGNETGDDADSGSESEGEVMTVTVGPDGEPVFEPQVLEIEPGTTVRFEWDSGGHNLAVVGQPDGADWVGVPEVQEDGFVHEHTFEAEGVYEYASEPSVDDIENPSAEEDMIGAIIVGNPGPG